MRRLVVYGAGGFGREVVTAARSSGLEIVTADMAAASFPGERILEPAQIQAGDEVVIAIAGAALRRKIAGEHGNFGTVIAPTAVIGADVEIGEGSIFCDFTMVTASATIGRHFHCNIYSYIAHDCVIGDFVTFAPAVCCNGNVHIGDDAYIGTGAKLRQGTPEKPLRIGAGAVVGMGAVVLHDVPDGATVVGNPARILDR